MKTAVVTICSGSFFERLAVITHPTIEAYARRIGAEFIVWRDFAGHTMPHYQKLELGKLLNDYDRVLFLDTDILVRDDTPDLFQLVPEDSLGMLEESKFVDRKVDTIQFMMAVGHDARTWDGKYYNSGVMVLSKRHQPLFVQPATEWDHFKEQTFLNLMIARVKPKIFSLPYRFNRMYFMDWLYGEDRCDCYLIHYAGFNLLMSESEHLELAAADRAAWERARPDYRFEKHVGFVLQGGLGDQAAAEPTIRYAREVLHKNDQLIIVSAYPHLFRHLGIEVYPATGQVPNSSRFQPRYNLTDPQVSTSRIDPRQVHKITLASLNLLGIELPTAYKRPKFEVAAAALAAVRQKTAPAELASLVVVHPGRGAAQLTAGAWQAIVDPLVENGCHVAVIGSSNVPDLGVFQLDTSRCLDLVDKLSVEELIALLAHAGVLLSSDSAAVQIAGAFDPWIGLIAPTMHPEHLLAWRGGSQSFRAKMLGDFAGDSTTSPDALPEPSAVLQFVREALQGT